MVWTCASTAVENAWLLGIADDRLVSGIYSGFIQHDCTAKAAAAATSVLTTCKQSRYIVR